MRMFCARGSRGGAFVRAPPARGHVGNTKGCRTALRVRLQVRAPQQLASRTELCSKLGHRLSQSLCIALANACRVCGCGSLLHCAGCTGFAVALLADGIRIRRYHSAPGTVWPSGLRRCAPQGAHNRCCQDVAIAKVRCRGVYPRSAAAVRNGVRCACCQRLPQASVCLRCGHALSGETVWPSGLRRWLQAPVRKGVGSNPTAIIALVSMPAANARPTACVCAMRSVFCSRGFV